MTSSPESNKYLCCTINLVNSISLRPHAAATTKREGGGNSKALDIRDHNDGDRERDILDTRDIVEALPTRENALTLLISLKTQE